MPSIKRNDLVIDSSPETDAASEPFIGLWNRLVSRTNWEKGQIICRWREALVAAGAPVTEYSDEAWAFRVGGVSGQHIGRLRRVYLRFGEVFEDYDRIYWSHFYAALDWPDAEMWLEGAVQNVWSVSQMRGKRWETLGSPDDLMPRDKDIVAGETDEDIVDIPNVEEPDDTISAGQVVPVKPSAGQDDNEMAQEQTESTDDSESPSSAAIGSAAPVRPFADLPDLPADLTDAFEQFKVAILAHKLNDWQGVACDDVLAALDALKRLALAPPGDG